MSTKPLIFLDTETTSLDRRSRLVWDLAYIRRDVDDDVESQFFVEVSLEHADPISLHIGQYYERHPQAFGGPDPKAPQIPLFTEMTVATHLAQDLQGGIIVGAVPSFDEETLAYLMFRNRLTPTWHYHLIDIESMAAGLWGLEPPWDFDMILDQAGLSYPPGARHTALGDARMVRDLYDVLMSQPRPDSRQG